MSLFLKDILNIARSRFSKEGCLTPRLDAEVLMCYTLNRDKSYLFIHYGDILDEKTCEEYFRLVDLRAGGMPVPYIIGKQEFMGLPFKVNEHVLIPRQDTETLVEKTIEELKKRKVPFGGFRILDLCCGSGAIAVSLAYHLKDIKIKITASDISSEALEIAKQNAKQNGVEDKIQFVEGDLFDNFPKNRKGKGKKRYDLIVSNPPYIPQSVLPTLMREVREHEPMLALDGGPDGIDYYIRILAEAYAFLKKDGILFLEIGHDQGQILPALAEAAGAYQNVEIIKDLAGRDRIARIKLKQTIPKK
jgi:release factor glutamine methyltransferase